MDRYSPQEMVGRSFFVSAVSVAELNEQKENKKEGQNEENPTKSKMRFMMGIRQNSR